LPDAWLTRQLEDSLTGYFETDERALDRIQLEAPSYQDARDVGHTPTLLPPPPIAQILRGRVRDLLDTSRARPERPWTHAGVHARTPPRSPRLRGRFRRLDRSRQPSARHSSPLFLRGGRPPAVVPGRGSGRRHRPRPSAPLLGRAGGCRSGRRGDHPVNIEPTAGQLARRHGADKFGASTTPRQKARLMYHPEIAWMLAADRRRQLEAAAERHRCHRLVRLTRRALPRTAPLSPVRPLTTELTSPVRAKRVACPGARGAWTGAAPPPLGRRGRRQVEAGEQAGFGEQRDARDVRSRRGEHRDGEGAIRAVVDPVVGGRGE